jgi:Bardet-Biedl syndrome 5 protein
VKSAHSRLRGSLQALVVCATFEASRYDFIFTSLVRASPRLFATAQAVHKAFETSRAYRTLRLRGAIIRPEDKAVVLLPRERVFTQLEGVWNLANESGNLGACTVTNQRFVWRATLTENFNVSIPYLIMVRAAKTAAPPRARPRGPPPNPPPPSPLPQSKVSIVNHAKFGPTLVMALTERSGGSLFGFRVEPAERMAVLEKEVVALREACFTAPDFGVTFTLEDEGGGEGGGGGGAGSGSAPLAAGSEDVEIVSAMRVGREAGGGRDAYAAYLAEGSRAGDRAVVFSHELGLAVEAPPAGMSVSELWLTL